MSPSGLPAQMDAYYKVDLISKLGSGWRNKNGTYSIVFKRERDGIVATYKYTNLYSMKMFPQVVVRVLHLDTSIFHVLVCTQYNWAES